MAATLNDLFSRMLVPELVVGKSYFRCVFYMYTMFLYPFKNKMQVKLQVVFHHFDPKFMFRPEHNAKAK